MTDRCKYCKNRATHYVGDPHNGSLCEIHYAYIKPYSARINPIDVGRCMRCGCKSTNRNGTEERLIDHHVNYYLDLTVPVCDSCHQEIHGKTPKDQYLEATERQDEPYTPRGSGMQMGIAIHQDYRDDGKPRRTQYCPDCGVELIRSIEEMGFDKVFLCPNSNCSTTGVAFHKSIRSKKKAKELRPE